MAGEPTFTATVKMAGVNPYVDVPDEVTEALGGGKQPVLLTVAAAGADSGGPVPDQERLRKVRRLTADGWFRTTLVPSRSGPTRLYLDTWMREAAGAGLGDRVRVRLRPDPDQRTLPMPEPLREALLRDPAAQAAWQALTPSRRRDILAYLNFLKSPAALERNVHKTVTQLRTRATTDG